MDTEKAKKAVAEVFSRTATTYDSVGDPVFAPHGEALVRRVALAPGNDVLDVACGTGAVLFPALDAVGPDGRVIGVDLAEGMIARTKELLARSET